MYSSERNGSINWKDIFTKLLFITLFVFLLLWLFPKVPNMSPFYSNVFRENIKYMQDTARNYYTNERLPKNIGDVSEMTLQEMIDKSLILPFVDKNGKSCNTTESYVQVKMEEKEYRLKVNLVCDDESDYITELLGTHDYSISKKEEVVIEEKKEESKEIPQTPEKNNKTQQQPTYSTKTTVTEYEYKKAIVNSSTTYTCPDGYTKIDKYCYKDGISDKRLATKVYSGGEKIVEPAQKYQDISSKVYYSGNISYVDHYEYKCTGGTIPIGSGSSLQCYSYSTIQKKCPSDYKLNSSGTRCYKYAGEVKTKVEYGLWGNGYTVYGINLTNKGDDTTRYILQNSKTNEYTKQTRTKTTKTYCSNGEQLGSYCYYFKEYTKSCPSGSYDSSIGYCKKNVTSSYRTKTAIYGYKCPSNYTPEGSGSSLRCYKINITKGNYYCSNPNATYSSYNHTCYYYTDKVVSGYTCPYDYDRDGEYCYKPTTHKLSATPHVTKITTYDYQWSTQTSLYGWAKTGNTRQITL